MSAQRICFEEVQAMVFSTRSRFAIPALVALATAPSSVSAARSAGAPDAPPRKDARPRLEFRIAANERDDAQAIEAARKYFAGAGNDPTRKAELDERSKRDEPPPSPKPADGTTFTTPLGQFTYSWARLAPSIVREWTGAEKEEGKGTSVATKLETARRRGEPIVIPPGILVYGHQRGQKKAEKVESFLLLRDPEKGKAITGQHLERATAAPDGRGHWAINVRLTEEGGKRLKELTSKNQPFAAGTPRARQLAIVVNGEVMATPSIRSLIAGPDCMISGRFSKQNAETIVTLLRSTK
jgi:hypothetical protein